MKKRTNHFADLVQKIQKSRNSFDKSNKENLFPRNQISNQIPTRNPSKQLVCRKKFKQSNQNIQRQSKSVGLVNIDSAFHKVKKCKRKKSKKLKIDSFDHVRLKTDLIYKNKLSPKLTPKLKVKKYFNFNQIKNITFKNDLKKNFEQIIKKQNQKQQQQIINNNKKKTSSPLRRIKSTKFLDKLTFADYCKVRQKKSKPKKNLNQKIKSPRNKKQSILIERIFVEKKIIKIDLISLTDLILELKQVIAQSNYSFKNFNGINLITVEKILNQDSQYYKQIKNSFNYYQIFYKFAKEKIISQKQITELATMNLEIFKYILIAILIEYNKDKRYQIEYNFLNDFLSATFKYKTKSIKQQEVLGQITTNIGIFVTQMNFIIQSFNLEKNFISNILNQIEHLNIKKCSKIAIQIIKVWNQQNQQILLERFSDCSIWGQDNELNFLFQPLCQESNLSFQVKEKNYTLVLDLDETLIHFEENEEGGTFLVRPFVKEFLNDMNKLFELVVYTAAVQEYADWILEKIDPDHLITQRFY